MRSAPKAPHLSHDDLLKALIDRTDLQEAAAAHLESCEHCRTRLERIGLRFQRMGRLAAELAPGPRRAIRLEPGRRSVRRSTRTVWAAGLAAAMAWLIIAFWPESPVDHPPAPQPRFAVSDHKLLEEVDALIENALPPAIRQIAAVTAPRPDHDLINWIVPSIDEKNGMI